MLKTFRRIRHFFDLPEATLEEIQARLRVEDKREPEPRRWHPCERCKVLFSGTHTCEVKSEPEPVKARRWRVV